MQIDCVGFNDMSTLVSHFMSSPKEKEKRDRRDSSGDEREGQGQKSAFGYMWIVKAQISLVRAFTIC